MVKRKVKDLEDGAPAEEPRRSSRRKPVSKVEEDVPKETNTNTAKKGKKIKETKGREETSRKVNEAVKKEDEEAAKPTKTSKTLQPAAKIDSPSKTESTGRQYWLMKAEPESRFEKGHDIKFSIDDLASKKVPEPWDGIRAYPARNNLRAMKKGDLAFFYHSSCKIPAIVGIMEIVQEHTPDLSAHDPSAPYHDPSSSPENPKWSVVHVEFRQKLETPITLKELREWQGESGNPLKEMQMLKLTRLSVSKVRSEEWDFLIAEMGKRGDVVKW